MSKMSELSYDIEQMYIDGHSAKSIAMILGIPLYMVSEQLAEWSVADQPQEPEEYDPFGTMNS
jgi:DNA-binding CsgD family transcriptional regulator